MSSDASAKREYLRISDERRDELIRQVVIYKVQIKLAAAELGIKYTSAKSILEAYRKKSPRPVIKPYELDLNNYPTSIIESLYSFRYMNQ